MSISIDNLVLPEHLIEMFQGSMEGVFITGKAMEDEGKKIFAKLGNYKKDDKIQLKDNLKFQKSGIYRIDSIELHLEDKITPAIYRFQIDLKHQ